MPEDEKEGTGRGHPLWARILIAAMMLATGAGIGGIAGESWTAAFFGALVAAPFAALGFMVPGLVIGVLYVLQVFSCAS
ncbi:hypothetical protein GXW74_11005 [Roseomonas eburnea]|uniref:Uncharacterized protein n=1 Tax=Neoroseomonas eburnea TaxID=1346889 RepID=A0A9X9XBD1_9PROT|nr:hypothetical protein [Neoroseomonas eburnea]MBR0681017.1 hypothetical protein [Neoroseomonas eburnea]